MIDRMTRNNLQQAQRRNSRCDRDGSELLKKISQIDFALYDLTLYLDAYPDCTDALSTFNQLNKARATLADEYQKLYGPITAFADSSDSWNWVKTPWPWE